MDLGICPKEITILTPIELMFISKAKVFQTVIKLGAVGRNVPQNSRLSALKGNCIHMPLPLEHTIKQLADDVGFSKLPSNYIMTHHIKGNELLLRNLVNLDNVYEALVWLKNNNAFYSEINLPPRSDLLFTSLSSQHLPDPTHSSELASSYVTGDDVEQADNNLENLDACSIHTKSSNEESLVKNRKDNGNNKAQNKSFKTINTGSVECNVINNQENPPDVLEQVELDIENNPPEMIKRLNSLQIQGMMEQYSVVDTDTKRNTILDVNNFYELLKIDSEPLSRKDKNIDMQAFPNIFPDGKGGQDSKREVYLQPNMYEKTRLLSGNSAVRRNMQYLFYLLQISEKRLINQGVYNTIKNVKFLGQKNVGQLLQMMKEDNNDIERNLNRVVSKIPNSPSYWNAPRSQLKCLAETHGPATFFITFSPAEYDWPDLHTYLLKHNKDLATPEGICINSLSTMDPVLTSAFIHQKFNSLHNFIIQSSCLGIVAHWFYRIEYQSRGTPHFHCLFWIKDAPIVGQSSDENVMNFISEHITCELPSKSTDLELYNLVNKYQKHTCGNYCLRSRKSKKGKFCKACRFSFPRTVTSKLILFDPVESILGRLSSDYKKRFYHCKRNQEEVRINDYNKILISQWNANMDIQFISESTYSLVGYVTKYITKGDKSHLSNDDFGLEDSIIRKLWSVAYGGLKGREIGAYEASDRWFLDSLYASSAVCQFVSTVYSNNRTRMMKNLKDLEETDPNSSDIYNRDLLSTFYPERPNHMENMSLIDYAASYERAYLTKKGNAASSNTNSNIIKLNGDNGIMKKRLKKALIYHHEFDPNVNPEKYYYSLLLLFKPWRKDSDLLEKCTTYKEEFDQIVNDFPQLKEYDQRKQKIMNSKKKVDDEVSKKLEKIEEEGVDFEPEVGIDDGNALDQVLYDFDAINNVDSISTEAELDAIVETLNIDQRRIYDQIISAIIHSLAHAIKSCECDSFQPLLLYVSGFGGTGKSYLIKTIMAWAYIKTNVLKTKCKIILAAPTGISAAGISGMTLHSALSLPIEHNGKMSYKPLTGANLQQIQACMCYVHCVMIDEISMVSNMTLLHVHLRLTEIFGCKNGKNNLFGSQVVVVFGDLLQLPPVKGEEVFLSLSENQIKAAIGMMSKNLSLWSHFSYDELKINQRQKKYDNAQFKECLSRIRLGFVLSDDIKLLSNRLISVSKVNPMESLVCYYNNLAKDGDFPVCLLPTRTMVCEFNYAQ